MTVNDLFLAFSIGFFFPTDSAFDFFFVDRVEGGGGTGLERVFIAISPAVYIEG